MQNKFYLCHLKKGQPRLTGQGDLHTDQAGREISKLEYQMSSENTPIIKGALGHAGDSRGLDCWRELDSLVSRSSAQQHFISDKSLLL